MIDIEKLRNNILMKVLKDGDEFFYDSKEELLEHLPYYVEEGWLSVLSVVWLRSKNKISVRVESEKSFALKYSNGERIVGAYIFDSTMNLKIFYIDCGKHDHLLDYYKSKIK